MSDENVPSKGDQQTPPTILQHTRTIDYHGPIPPPAVVEGWEKVLPGAAGRILKMAEDEAEHRRRLESAEQSRLLEATRGELGIRIRGQWFSLSIVGALVAVGTVFTALGKDVGGVAAILTAGALIAMSFNAARQRKNDGDE